MKATQHRIEWWATELGAEEAQAAANAIRNRQISRGPLTDEFEDRVAALLGVEGVIAVPSGSCGLLLALMSLDIGPGDEVIVPDLTWIATAHAARILGAEVRLVDCLPERPVMDPARVALAITPQTKAIVPVHLTGRAAPMEELLALADLHGIPVVEDAAQAFSSRGPDGVLGALGNVGVFSLGLAKLVSTGQGGLVATRDAARLERMRRATMHGVDNTGAGENYRHLGLNMKFPDFAAAVGLVQLDRLESKRERVCAVYRAYQSGLQGLEGIAVEPFDLDAGELPLWTEVRVDDSAALEARLESVGIETHRLHKPLHHASHLSARSLEGATFAESERHARDVLILPSGPDRALADVERVVEAIRHHVQHASEPLEQGTTR